MGIVLNVIRGNEVAPIREEVEIFAQEIMGKYLEECSRACKKRVLSGSNTKNFYDSVWGTIEISEGEILIVDSPILQRLRSIKQLGLADLLYSSANHSRFSHTLGVIQTADVMQRQIEKELDKKGQHTDHNVNQLIRLAAIFHDCGHMFCSHASERFFQKNDTYSQYNKIERIRKAFYSQLGIKPSLSEIISVCIVQSPVIDELFTIVEPGLEKIDYCNGKKDEVIEKICCFILGFPYSEKMLPYSQIISGQIDSDKLDYLKRDSHATGVPAAVDMSRVFQKLRVVETKKKFTMKSTSDEDTDTRYTIAIAPAAINTVDQLIVSRYMMFENVYFHQKTLTAEEILRYAISKLDNSTEGIMDNFTTILKLTDSDVIHGNFAANISHCGVDFKIKNQVEYDEACLLLGNLYKRKLFKRSVAFSNENLVNIGHKGCDFYSSLFKTKNEREQKKFVGLVKQIAEQWKNKISGKEVEFNRETDLLLIIAPDISNVSINSNLAIAEKDNKYRDMEFEADNWLKSRSTRKPQNFLVTYPEDRYLVYLATEYVLLKEYGMLIADSLIFDEKDKKAIEQLRDYLNSNGVYCDATALRPEKAITIYNRQIEYLVNEKWKSYELVSEDNGFATSMNISHLVMFLKQFYQFEKELGGYDIFVKYCIEMLEKVSIVSKGDIIRTLNSNLNKVINREKCSFDRLKICNIGNVQDSSAQIAYQINSINFACKSKLQVQNLQDALRLSEENQIIVFIDDAFCSGKQILSVFETYMGIPIEERQTSEVHVVELSREEKDKLIKSKLYFSFCFYNKENESFFLEGLKRIGLKNVDLIADREFPVGYFKNDDTGDREESLGLVKSYFEAAGKMLIEQKAYDENGKRKQHWTDQRMQDSVLGYNDAQQLIVFAWNTPTYTMTPLWMGSNREGKEWYPLFPRIDK